MSGKIRRELSRVGHQISDSVTVVGDYLATRRWDRRFPAMLQVTKGTHQAGGRVALLVLFQPGGLAPSTFDSCSHLLSRGYAPVVVSNAPLSGSDLEKLAAVSAFVVIRPNRGYDFGAYRDGLRFIEEVAGLDPEVLLMINDSIWFPTTPDEGLIPALEAEGDDFTGAVLVTQPGREHRAHYQSYFFLIRRAARQHPAFVDFWRRYLLSDARRKVLLRGEKAFSQALFTAGFAPRGIISRAGLQQKIEDAPPEFLRKVLQYAAWGAKARERQIGDALLRDYRAEEDWAARARDHIRRTTASSYYHCIFFYAVCHYFPMPFIKKRNREDDVEMRRNLLAAIEAGDMPPLLPQIELEIRQGLAKVQQ